MSFLLTDIALFSADVYQALEDNNLAKYLLGSFYIFTFIIGVVLNLCLFSYERNEGDPQKRGLLNQVRQSSYFHITNETIMPSSDLTVAYVTILYYRAGV